MAVLAAALLSTAADWQPIELVLLLFVLAVGSDLLTVEVRGLRVSGSFLAIVLAMALLGPAPAVAIGAASAIDRRARLAGARRTACSATSPPTRRSPLRRRPRDPARHFRRRADQQRRPRLRGARASWCSWSRTSLNFFMVATSHRLQTGDLLSMTFRSRLLPVAPVGVRDGAAHGGRRLLLRPDRRRRRRPARGRALRLPVPAARGHRRRTSAERSSRAHARARVAAGRAAQHRDADALDARRDDGPPFGGRGALRARGRSRPRPLRARPGPDPHRRAAARHRQVHLPGLDPLRRPQAHRRRVAAREAHPEQGAKLVRRIEGYGPVADIISPTTSASTATATPIPQEQIPLGSRIIAIADTYDVMTSRDSYRRPVSCEAAIMELRRVSGSQLDGDAGRDVRGDHRAAASPSAMPTSPTSSASSLREAGRRLREARVLPSPRRVFDQGECRTSR